MHLLHQALDNDGELREIVANLSSKTAGNAVKHAIVLDLNPFWLACYRLSEAGLDEKLLSYYFPGPGLYSWNSQGAGGGFIDVRRKFSESVGPTKFTFGDGKNPASPYMLRIFARPTPDGSDDWASYRRQLINAARETPIPTIVETQEPARLLAAPGDRVTSSTGVLGTLGGFVLDQKSSAKFAMTCGHVISGGPASATTGTLGPCTYAAVPIALPAGVGCTNSCGFVTQLDVALIDVTGTSVTNVATGIAAIVSPGDTVSMNGATSGSRSYEVGGVVVEHSIGGSCWNRLFLFHAPVNTGILPVGVHVALTPPPDDGDSGSWLLRGATEWAGMVVAANPLLGFALAGTAILAESDKSFGTQLKLA